MKSDLERAFWAAVDAAHPQKIMAATLPSRPAGRAYVFAVGKAAVPMAAAVEAQWGGDLKGMVVAPHDSESSLRLLPLNTAAHPYPDERGAATASALLASLRSVPKDAEVLFLLSGGASSLLLATEEGPSPEQLKHVTKALLNGGADIHALNTVRRVLSPLLGGGAALVCPGNLQTLAISDVVGDDPIAIGSGPTVANPTGPREALALLEKFGGGTPEVTAWISQRETTSDLKSCYTIIASGPHSLKAAKAALIAMGHDATITADSQVGLADDNALMLAERVRRRPEGRPQIWLMGGEVDVVVKGQGRGGRNVQFAARLAQALDGVPGWQFLAADTDGQDGNAPNAGAFCDGTSWQRARSMGLDPDAFLNNNDAHSLFELIGDAFITGPTGTNVNDFRALAFT
ncbi:MAG: glycerate kinase type-2 family protein [Alphaproteobacteria bacterium]